MGRVATFISVLYQPCIENQVVGVDSTSRNIHYNVVVHVNSFIYVLGYYAGRRIQNARGSGRDCHCGVGRSRSFGGF